MEETKIIELSNRFFKLIVVLILAIAVFLAGQLFYQFGALPQNYPKEITVSGEGKSFAKPDIALVNLGVNTQEAKSQEAVDKNNKIMNEIIKSMKDLGVEDKDIQTIAYNLAPVYDYTESGRVFRGYSLNQHIRVKIRNFDKINNILDEATSGGATTVGDLLFTVDDYEKFRTEARAEAVKQAKQKALTLTAQAGLRLGKLVNISEGYGPAPAPFYRKDFAATAAGESIPPQIQTGQLEVNSSVTLTYRVR